MTSAPDTIPEPDFACPAWCVVPPEEHAAQLAQNASAFYIHRSHRVDDWTLTHDDHPVSVQIDHYVVPATGGDDLIYRPTITVEGQLDRGCQDLAELDIEDARRLATAMLRACDLVEATR